MSLSQATPTNNTSWQTYYTLVRSGVPSIYTIFCTSSFACFACSATFPWVIQRPTCSSLWGAAAPRYLVSACPRLRPLQLLLAACVRFESAAAPWPDCIRFESAAAPWPDCIRFNCCSPFASASAAAACSPLVSASAAAPRLLPLRGSVNKLKYEGCASL